MVNRIILKNIQENLNKYPVIVLTGPRQSGKTTFLKKSFQHYQYINFENPDERSYALDDPKRFLNEYNDKVIFDEAQQVPQLFSYIQTHVDEREQMGEFILSGSQNFHLMEKISQSLSGRAAIFKLYPFDLSEMSEANWITEDLAKVMTSGFYPAIFQRSINPDRYYADYLETYVKRDVFQIVNIQDQRSFLTFIKLCASRAGSLVNYNDLGRDAGISHTTVKHWISVLETSFIIYLLPPYYKNYSKRRIKSPKLYFYDTGLLCHLLDIRKGKVDPLHPMWGNIFENMIITELNKQNEHQSKFRDYYFWRDSHGNEVDLLYPDGNELNIYEIKASKTILTKSFKSLDYFSKIATDPINKKVLVYGGDSNQRRTKYEVLGWKNVN